MEPSPSGSLPTAGNNFQLKKKEFQDNVGRTIDQSQELCDVLSSELQSCNELMIKQIFVSERFSDFHAIWRSIDFNQDIEGYLLYREIDQEVFRLGGILDTYEEKAQKASEILRGMTTTLSARLRELDVVRTKCDNAMTLQEVEALTIPDLTGIEDIPYPDLNEVNQKWRDENIYPKLNRSIEALESLIF